MSLPSSASSRRISVLLIHAGPTARRSASRDDADRIAASIPEDVFRVERADSVDEAAARPDRSDFDAFLAVQEPGSDDAFRFLDAARKTGCTAPVLLLQERGAFGSAAEAIRRGAADCLAPSEISAGELARALKSAIHRDAAVAELRSHAESFRGICAGAGLGILLFDDRGNLLYCNPALAKILAAESPDEICGKDLERLLPAEACRKLQEARRELGEAAGSRFRRFDARMPDGRWLRFTVSPWESEDRDRRFAVAMLEDVGEEKRSAARLERSRRAVRRMARKLLEAQEQERKAVALDIHDSVGGALSVLRYSLERKIPVPLRECADTLHADIELIQRAAEDIRRIQSGLRPCMLDDIGIGPTLRWYCREFGARHPGIRVSLSVTVAEEGVPEPLRIVLFRIVQEALTNAGKHSGARRIEVSLERRARRLRLFVADDGNGIAEGRDDDFREEGLGLGSMRERAAHSGGRLTVRSAPGGGTAVEAVWELEEGDG